MSAPVAAPEVLLRVRDEDRASIEAQLASAGLQGTLQPVQGRAPALGIIDPEVLGGDLASRLQRAAEAYPQTPIFLLSGSQERTTLADLVEVQSVAAVIARDTRDRHDELQLALAILRDGLRFGLASLAGATPPLVSRELVASHDRDDVIEELEGRLTASGVRPRMARLACDAVEELVTNAIYDAPTDESGDRIYAATDRRESIFLAASARPRLDVAVVGTRVIALMSDPHGSLDVVTVRRFLAQGLRGDVSDKPGGAGLGLARIYGLVDRLVVQIEPRRRTEIAFMLETGAVKRDPAHRPTGLIAWSAGA